MWRYLKNTRGKPIVSPHVRDECKLSAQEARFINDEIAAVTPKPKQKKARHGIRYSFIEKRDIANYARLHGAYNCSKKYNVDFKTAQKYKNILVTHLKRNKTAKVS